MQHSTEKESNATLNSIEDHQAIVSLESLAIPVAILSHEDGVVVYTNSSFKSFIQNCPVGKPLPGLLHTESERQAALQKIKQRGQYVFSKKNPTSSLRFNVTQELYLDSPHFFVCIERPINPSTLTSTESAEAAVLNRNEFIRRVNDLLDDRTDQDSSQCLCCIDIDHFRIVNEKFGIDAGDYVLDEMYKVIKKETGSSAAIGRLGSNEFGVLLPDTQIDNALQICEAISQAVKDYPFIWNDETIKLTTSIGVVPVRKQLDDVDFVLGAADLSLRAAKENGRDCVHSSVTQDTMMAYHSDNMHYALVIEDALQNDKFQLYAQPIVSLSDPTKHDYYEILLRSYDSNAGDFISSQELISAAESLEVTTKIDQWVCENVFKSLSEKSLNGTKVPIVSINLSGHSIVNSTFEKFIKELVDKYNVPTDRVCFEITESVAVKSISRAQRFIENLREIGIKFSLDDFGVGYCSFNYLQQLKVDNVKIDGAFVSAMLDSATQFAMVKAITDVARAMNIKTIAEFIEKPEIIKALTVIGVDYGQGYIFGKPAPLQDLF